MRSNKDKITVKDLKQFPEFDLNPTKKENNIEINITPDDAIRNIIEENNKHLKKQILEKIMQKDPYFFENLILDMQQLSLINSYTLLYSY